MKKIMLLLALMAIAPLASAQEYRGLDRFLADFSDHYSGDEYGKKIKRIRFADGLDLSQFEGVPVMYIFWSGADEFDAYRYADSIRSEAMLTGKILGVNISDTEENIRKYRREHRIIIPSVSGSSAAKFAKSMKITETPTVILTDADGAIRGKWENISRHDLHYWAKTAAWIVNNPDVEYNASLLGTLFLKRDYSTGMYAGQRIDWDDDEQFKNGWYQYGAFITSSVNKKSNHVLEFYRYVYDRIKALYGADSEEYRNELFRLADQLSYTSDSAQNAPRDVCEFGIKLFEEVFELMPEKAESYITIDRLRTLYHMHGGYVEKSRELANRAMKLARQFEEKSGQPLHPKTVEYLQRYVDFYDNN